MDRVSTSTQPTLCGVYRCAQKASGYEHRRQEATNCAEWLEKEIAIFRPHVIVLLGRARH